MTRYARALLVSVALGALIAPVAFAAPREDGHDHDRLFGKRIQQMQQQPDGAERLADESHRAQLYQERWHAVHEALGEKHVSRKGQRLLERRGLGRSLLNDAGTGLLKAATPEDPDTLRVLIVRISFENNRDPHLTTIPEDGDFMLEPLEEPDFIEVDKPPHNRRFFESHLQGLSEYYRFQSGGRLVIEGDVLPHEENGSYKLGDIADYGPGADHSWMESFYLDRLEDLVRDMIAVTDSTTLADGPINLADYDDDNPFAYVIFVHAGSDWQSDVNQDSPNDIPTFFMTLGEAMPLLGTDSTTGAAGLLGEVSVIPETTNQDGYKGSIAAALYHEFGHALGLVDVYNTYYGTTTAGVWDLMDSGTNLSLVLGKVATEADSTFGHAAGDTVLEIATGVLPPSLGVWNKWFLGWVEMDEVDGRTGSYYLPPVWVPRDEYSRWQLNSTYPQALRAGVSEREFFLLENRWVPEYNPDFNPLPYVSVNFAQDPETDVILYLEGTTLAGTTFNSGMYDYFMPYGGVLVWHVNQDRIEAGLADNTINTEWDGLRLVEADGIQDIGVLDAYTLGWLGSDTDAFGDRYGFQNLYADGAPHSRCFDRSFSGLTLTDVRPATVRSDKTMRFEAELLHGVSGFPLDLDPIGQAEADATAGVPGPRGLDPASLTTIPIGDLEYLVFADAGPDTGADGSLPEYDHFPTALYVRRADGSAPFAQLPGRPTGAVAELTAPLAGPPVAEARDGGSNVLAVGTVDGMMRTWTVGTTSLSERWYRSVADTLRYAPIPFHALGDPAWLLADESALGVVLDASGDDFGESYAYGDGGPVCRPLVLPDALGHDRIAAFHPSGWSLIRPGSNSVPEEFGYPREPLRAPVYAVLLPDGELTQLHVFDADGDVGAWEIGAAGNVRELEDRIEVTAPLVTEPAVADVDGDGRHDLILATATRVQAFGPGGTVAAGYPLVLRDLFPLADTTRVRGPLIVADATGDGAGELFFFTDGGHVFGIEPGGQLMPETPLRWAGRADGGAIVGRAAMPAERTLWIARPGGKTGPPLDRQFINGRIMGFDLGLAATERTSEWLGAGGGPARGGPVGEPQSVEIEGMATAEESGTWFYPNPLRDDTVTLRFYGKAGGKARFSLHNLEGEEVVQLDLDVQEGVANELRIPLPQIASGMYIGRLVAPTPGGHEIQTLTLAVER